jgi:hypothetical protein
MTARLAQRHAMKTYVGVGVQHDAFGGCSASRRNFFISDDEAPIDHSIGERVGSKAGILGEENALYLPKTESLSPVTMPLDQATLLNPIPFFT